MGKLIKGLKVCYLILFILVGCSELTQVDRASVEKALKTPCLIIEFDKDCRYRYDVYLNGQYQGLYIPATRDTLYLIIGENVVNYIRKGTTLEWEDIYYAEENSIFDTRIDE